MKLSPYCLSLLLIPALAGCATTESGVANWQISPNKTGEPTTANGFLQIYTATKTVPDGDSTFEYPYTRYTIDDSKGRYFRFVPNHLGIMDRTPSLVTLPAGNYLINANSEQDGHLTFPVEVKPGQTTIIHLDEQWTKSPDHPPRNQLVRKTDGKIVGWLE